MQKKNAATNLESLLAAAKGATTMRVVFFRRAFQAEDMWNIVDCRDFANQLNFTLQTIGWKIKQETYHVEVRSDAGNYICDYQDFNIAPDDETFDKLVKLAGMLDGAKAAPAANAEGAYAEPAKWDLFNLVVDFVK